MTHPQQAVHHLPYRIGFQTKVLFNYNQHCSTWHPLLISVKVYCTYFLLRSKINSLSGINFSKIFHHCYSFISIISSLLFICPLSTWFFLQYCRYIESGYYRGFTNKVGQYYLTKQLNVNLENIFPWSIYTDIDMKLKQKYIIDKQPKR